MSDLIIVRGLPGSGKSTFAKKMHGYTHVETDMYHIDEDGVYKFDEDNVEAAMNWVDTTIKCLLQAGQNVVVSGVMCSNKHMFKLCKLARDCGTTATIVELPANYGNIHGVGAELFKTMQHNWEAFDPMWEPTWAEQPDRKDWA